MGPILPNFAVRILGVDHLPMMSCSIHIWWHHNLYDLQNIQLQIHLFSLMAPLSKITSHLHGHSPQGPSYDYELILTSSFSRFLLCYPHTLELAKLTHKTLPPSKPSKQPEKPSIQKRVQPNKNLLPLDMCVSGSSLTFCLFPPSLVDGKSLWAGPSILPCDLRWSDFRFRGFRRSLLLFIH